MWNKLWRVEKDRKNSPLLSADMISQRAKLQIFKVIDHLICRFCAANINSNYFVECIVDSFHMLDFIQVFCKNQNEMETKQLKNEDKLVDQH